MKYKDFKEKYSAKQTKLMKIAKQAKLIEKEEFYL